MQLSRAEIERWFKNSGANIKGGTGGGGGGQNVDLSSYAQKSWVDESYVAKSFFNQLFTVHGTKTTTVGSGTPTVEAYTFAPNEVPGTTQTTENNVTTTVVTAITDIEVGNTSLQKYVGLWTSSFLSALGQGSGGGGGGASALADLTDVSLSSPTNGQALVYNATSHKWENQTIGGGGGGTLTSIGLVMPTGFAVSPATLTADGSFTVSFATGYGLPLTADVQKGVTAYNNLANYLPISTTFWGRSIANGVVNGNMTDVGNLSMNGILSGAQGIELNTATAHGTSHGGHIDFHFNGSSADYTARIIEIESGVLRIYDKLRIGNAVFEWDSENNALKIQKYDGGLVNVYATGGVSALGYSS